jgi:hypothetical protein
MVRLSLRQENTAEISGLSINEGDSDGDDDDGDGGGDDAVQLSRIPSYTVWLLPTHVLASTIKHFRDFLSLPSFVSFLSCLNRNSFYVSRKANAFILLKACAANVTCIIAGVCVHQLSSAAL